MSAILKMLQNRAVEVELKSEVVEFGVAQDVEKTAAKLKASVGKLEDLENKAKAAGKKYEQDQLKAYSSMLDKQESLFSQMDKLRAVNKDSKDILAKAEKAAKDLGVNVNDIKGFKELKALSGDYAAEWNGVSSEIKKIENITI